MSPLPLELLSKIFEVSSLSRRDRLALILVCHAFRRQAQRIIYRDIRLTAQTRGKSTLYEQLAHDPTVAFFVRRFSLDARSVEYTGPRSTSRMHPSPFTTLDNPIAFSPNALRSNFQKRSPESWKIIQQALQNMVNLEHLALDFGGDIKTSDDFTWLFDGCAFKLRTLNWPFVLTPATSAVLEQQNGLEELEMLHATGFVHAASTTQLSLPSQNALPNLRILTGPALFIGEMRQRYPHITHIRFSRVTAFQSPAFMPGVRVLVTSLTHLKELMGRVDAASRTLEYIQVEDDVGQSFQQLRIAFRDSLAPSLFPSLRVLRIFTTTLQDPMQQFEILAMPLSLTFPRLQTVEIQKRSDRLECWRWTRQGGIKTKKMPDKDSWKSY